MPATLSGREGLLRLGGRIVARLDRWELNGAKLTGHAVEIDENYADRDTYDVWLRVSRWDVYRQQMAEIDVDDMSVSATISGRPERVAYEKM